MNLTKTPLTRSILVFDDEINHLISSKKKNFSHLPCQTQAMETCVKLDTKASFLVCGKNSRNGFIRSRIELRQKRPSFETKREFKA